MHHSRLNNKFDDNNMFSLHYKTMIYVVIAGANLAIYSRYGKLEIIRFFSTETTRKSSMVRQPRNYSFRQYPLGGAVFRIACTSARLIHCIADSGRPVSWFECVSGLSVYPV